MNKKFVEELKFAGAAGILLAFFSSPLILMASDEWFPPNAQELEVMAIDAQWDEDHPCCPSEGRLGGCLVEQQASVRPLYLRPTGGIGVDRRHPWHQGAFSAEAQEGR